MPNSFDFAGRGPSNRQLFTVGGCFIAVVAVIAGLMIAKYQGRLDRFVRVSAELVNVGDGLPANSDVKFRGVLVGFVSGVVPAAVGKPNIVGINLRPGYAAGIPDTVTARVVPSNVFAVSSVELVDNGTRAAPLQSGAVIAEDQTLPTVLFQTTLTKFREVLKAIGREPGQDSIGWLTALGQATQGKGQRLQDAGRDMNAIVTQLNTVVSDDPTGPSTLAALTDATRGLEQASPELFDALSTAVKPMQTLAEKGVQLTDLLSTGLSTFGALGDSFEHHTDRMIRVTTELTPVIGEIADHSEIIHPIATRGVTVARKFIDEAWRPDANALYVKAVISFTPSRTYVRADCPRYGELTGPSCDTAPEIPVAPALDSALGSRGLPLPPGVSENRPNTAPPRDSVRHNPDEVGGTGPGPLPDEPPALPLLPAEAPPPNPADVQPQSAGFGGTVGPVGSREEKAELGQIVGGEANAASVVLLGPLARGSAVQIAPAAEAGR